MTLGDVDEDWAREHHPKWVEPAPTADREYDATHRGQDPLQSGA